MIITGEIPPGERLKIERLKVMLGTGTSPIREALSLLTSDQLVERIDQRGFRAAPASVNHFQEILALRCQLEPIALGKSIELGDNQWEEELVLIHHRLTRTPRYEIAQFENLHKEFHMAMIGACQSPILLRFCVQLYDLNVRYRYLAGKSDDYSQRDIPGEHTQLMEAVINRDNKLACKNLVAHYEKTGEFLAANLSD